MSRPDKSNLSLLTNYITGFGLGRQRPRLNIKTAFPMYGYSHVKDKTVA